MGVSQAGLAIMAAGLLIEGVADLQKSHFKEKYSPHDFCSRYATIFHTIDRPLSVSCLT